MEQDRMRPRMGWSGLPLRIWRFYARFVRMLMTLISGTVLLCLGVLFLNYVVLSTPKGQAYRNLDPSVPACRDGLAHGWSVLADIGREKLRDGNRVDDDGWVDPSDVETDAIARDPKWKTLLRCSLQRHIVPAMTPGGKPIDYTLGFLEFQENGEPYALLSRDAGADQTIDSAMLEHAMETEMHTKHMAASAVHPVITQLDALKTHLAAGSNFVVVFIHGWRHDARIGNQNVADLRLYAAHAARFIQERCHSEPKFCAMKVTAIYVGWRGARVDEQGLRETFGETIGGIAGNISAGATLFDRKPVAETIAPSAISALRTIETELAAQPGPNKMIVFGHSLGGDLLATGLKDDLLRSIDRHVSGQIVPPVLGNLVVLINPAAEATKWTALQREVSARMASDAAMRGPGSQPDDDSFFAPTQRPVIASVTAALAFPAGGLRGGDCAWIGLAFDDQFKAARERIRANLAATDQMFDSGVDYDWATHDLFPTFKFDFRPAAAYLEHIAARIEARQPEGESCATFKTPGLLAQLESLPVRFVSLIMATFPFQNSAIEESHTIGNLDPPRPAAGVLADALPSAAPFGTTHELLGLHKPGSEKHNPYATLADAEIDCPITDGWLTRARARRKDQGGMFWDSDDLAPAPGAFLPDHGAPTARFLHGLQLSGIAPITRANDPFWNLRAFDNALSRHDGYRLTSFICAMDQLVLDDITSDPMPLRQTKSEARQPGMSTVP